MSHSTATQGRKWGGRKASFGSIFSAGNYFSTNSSEARTDSCSPILGYYAPAEEQLTVEIACRSKIWFDAGGIDKFQTPLVAGRRSYFWGCSDLPCSRSNHASSTGQSFHLSDQGTFLQGLDRGCMYSMLQDDEIKSPQCHFFNWRSESSSTGQRGEAISRDSVLHRTYSASPIMQTSRRRRKNSGIKPLGVPDDSEIDDLAMSSGPISSPIMTMLSPRSHKHVMELIQTKGLNSIHHLIPDGLREPEAEMDWLLMYFVVAAISFLTCFIWFSSFI